MYRVRLAVGHMMLVSLVRVPVATAAGRVLVPVAVVEAVDVGEEVVLVEFALEGLVSPFKSALPKALDIRRGKWHRALL